MNYEILNSINSISDVKMLSHDKIEMLCDEIREFLVDKVGQNGGHLASNLGSVELTVAIHRVFNSPGDHIIFDVGHQSYVHKMLTGRLDKFDTLRIPGGLSGFTSRRESIHDAFGTGHSSTSISAALGFAESDKLLGNKNYTVAIVGDGACSGGMIHEALNNCKPDLNLIVVLNENGMAISSTKGTFASYISKLGNQVEKQKEENCDCPASDTLNYFESIGFAYIGVVDGNNVNKVEQALTKAKALNRCVFVHLKTKKGKGMSEAESYPEKFHSIVNATDDSDTFHSAFADALISLANENKDVVGITAAMGIGTGLSEFCKIYPDRFFDVGIAEGHALTFSAALAANGLKPFTAIYSTFMQRGYDSLIHDVALQGLPVKMFIDRAGLAVSDGATHHGIFDVAFLSHIPGIEILAPLDYDALKDAVKYAYCANNPIAVRYPNCSQSASVKNHFGNGDINLGIRCDFDPKDPPKRIFVTYGAITEKVLCAKQMLSGKGIDVGIVIVERIKPYSPTVEFMKSILSVGSHVVYVEEGIKTGGAASITQNLLYEEGALDNVKYEIAAIDDNFANPAELCDLYDYAGLSADKIASYFLK